MDRVVANPNLLIPRGVVLVAGNLKTNLKTLRLKASSCHSEWLTKTDAMILILGAAGTTGRVPHLFIPSLLTRIAPSAQRKR